jgi:LysM repeat protein
MKNMRLILFLFIIGIFSTIAQEKKFITYKVGQGETIQSISKSLSITPYDLLKLNPDIKDNVRLNDIIIIPNNNYDPKNDISILDLSNINDRDIIVDNYIYHEVMPKETIYSLLKKFKVSLDELNRSNPFLVEDELIQGQILKIPVVIDKNDIAEKEKNTQPYLVKPKETKFSISRNFGISIAHLEELNPKIKRDGLQIDDVIIVPKNSLESSDSDFTMYKVEKLETLYSLSNKFGLSQEELIDANPEIKEGIKEGMEIRIPNVDIGEDEFFVDEILEGESVNIGMMLPFMSKNDSLDFQNDRLLNITTDFYLGALLAVDSLKGQGLSINLHVYDTENNESVSKRISSQPGFNDFDAIIGPLFLKNVKAVSNNLYRPLIISPISTKDHSTIRNKNLVQEMSSRENFTVEMLAYIKSVYTKQKLIIIKNDSENSVKQFNRIFKEIQALDSTQEVVVLEPKDGYIKPEVFKVFRDTLDRDIENWFFLADNEEAFVNDVFNNLGVFPEVDELTLFAFETGRSYEKIDNNYLARVNFHYPSNSFIDRNTADYLIFEKKYFKKYFALPSKNAIEGFDITYDILMRLATNEDLINQGISQRIATKYNFIENTSGSIINNGIFIIKYEGLELKVVK